MGLGSWSKGKLDAVYASVAYRNAPPRAKFFQEGDGDIAELDRMESKVFSSPSQLLSWPPIQLTWDESSRTTDARAGLELVHGWFPSPCAEFLPKESEIAHVLCVRPIGVPDDELRGVVVHLAATGHQGYSSRRKLNADELASKHSIASLLVITPCYGKRAPAGQFKHFARTGSEYLRSAMATFTEAALVARWCETAYPRAGIVLHGYSYGGAMASAAVAQLRTCGEPGVIGVVSIVGTPSPLTLIRGNMIEQVDFSQFAGSKQDKLDHVEALLSRGLLERGIELTGMRDGATGYRVWATIVSARHDEIAIPSESHQLVASMKEICVEDGLHEVWIDGGHVSSIVWPASERKHVVEMVERMRDVRASSRASSSPAATSLAEENPQRRSRSRSRSRSHSS